MDRMYVSGARADIDRLYTVLRKVITVEPTAVRLDLEL